MRHRGHCLSRSGESFVNSASAFADQIRILTPVVTMGYPSLPGLRPALISSAGEIAGTADAYLDSYLPYLLSTCAVTGGSSGGPVVDAGGYVVGVVSALSQADANIDPGRFGLVAPAISTLPILVEVLQRARLAV
jgi:S1-C subfamily serine protease